MSLACQFCCFRCPAWRHWLRHTFEAHSSLPNFLVRCGIDGCPSTFKCLSSMQSHVMRKHPNGFEEAFNPSIVNGQEDQENEEGRANHSFDDYDSDVEYEDGESIFGREEDTDSILGGEEDAAESITGENASGISSCKRAAGLFLLTLKERHRLTQTSINFAMCQVKQMTSNIIQDLQENVESELQQHLTNTGITTPDLSHCFKVIDPFEGLETEHMQQKFYKHHFNLIEPVAVKLGTRLENIHSGPKRRLTEVEDTFQYVPFLESLEVLLSHPDVRDEVLRQHQRSDDLIADYCDAEFFKSHDFFGSSEIRLQIIIYFDEIEVCNPLGGHNGVHKLGMFYYTIGNLRPELRSTQRAIQLIACVTSSHITKYGLQPVLQPFIDDVNKLAKDGITITGYSKPLYGSVLMLLADTLAAHQLCGFKISPGRALRKCRHCNATLSLMNSKFKEEDFQLKTPSLYDRDCTRIEEGPIPEHDSVTYGLNYRSPLNSIEYFHVANPQVPQDVMHVLLEGVIPLETKLMLNEFIYNKKYFSLQFLNSRIKNFSYGREESRNKLPKAIEASHITSSEGKLRLSASQMWTLSTYLPLMIGDKVAYGDCFWECYLVLLEITKYCTARLTSLPAATYVAVLVEQHHRAFRQCYPGINMTPKTHYMIHFARQLVLIGPLVNSWCMRMEAKNSYFKRASQIGGNYKNIPYSVAGRHQRLMCAYFQGSFFSYDELECGPCKAHKIHSLGEDVLKESILQKLPETSLSSPVSRPNWIKIYGHEYHESCFLHVGFHCDDLPFFGKVVDIVTILTAPLVLVHLFTTAGINSHIQSYEVSPSQKEKLFLLSELSNKEIYHAHTYIGNGNLYITMRSFIPNAP